MKLSAVWIAKNEEANVARSINSVKDAVDEMVVVDTGSTDNTVAIAEKMGARVEHFTWVNDFSAARNHALSFATGDVVIFLDFDEWFEPPLTQKQRGKIEAAFKGKDGINVALVTQHNVTKNLGQLQSVDRVGRFLRGGGAVKYVGRIHEEVRASDGGAQRIGELLDFTTIHDGYTGEVMPQKVARNLEILKLEREGTADEAELARNAFYVMREAGTAGLLEEALPGLQFFLDNPKRAERWMEGYRLYAPMLMTQAVALARLARGKISRRQLKRAVIATTQKACRDYPAAVLAEHFYNIYFDDRDDVLLDTLPADVEKAERMAAGAPAVRLVEYAAVASKVYARAAAAALRRQDRQTTFAYAAKSLEQAEQPPLPGALHAMLMAVKGLPDEDVVQMLDTSLDTTLPRNRWLLIEALRCEGFTVPYSHYMLQSMESKKALPAEHWYSLIVLGQAALAAQTALKTGGDEDVRRTLFLAAACARDEEQGEELYRQYKAEMGDYAPLMAAMLAGGTLPAAAPEDLRTLYPLVAFAGGRPAAERLLRAYEKEPKLCFEVRYAYYWKSGLYADFLQDNPWQPPAEDAENRLHLALMLAMAGQPAAAFTVVEACARNSPPSEELFNLCALLREHGVPGAAELYAGRHPAFEEYIDAADAAHTGVVLDADDKRQRKQLAALDMDGLQTIAAEGGPPHPAQWDTLMKAGETYAAHKCYWLATRCYARLWALEGDPQSAAAPLAGVLRAAGNPKLAAAL